MQRKGLAWLAVFVAALALGSWLLLSEPTPVAPDTTPPGGAGSHEASGGSATDQHAGQATDTDPTLPLDRDVEEIAGGDHGAADGQPARVVFGRVVDANGHPVARAEVGLLTDSRKVLARRTRADGTFEIAVHRPGTFDVFAASTELGFGLIPDVAVEDARIDVGDVVLHPRAAVLGRLLFPDGQPVAGFGCRLTAVEGGALASRAGARSCAVETDAAGRLRAACLEPGAYRLGLDWVLVPDGQGEAYQDIVWHTGAGEAEARIDLHRLRLRGQTPQGCRGWWAERDAEVRETLAAGADFGDVVPDVTMAIVDGKRDLLVQRGSRWLFTTRNDDRWGQVIVHAERSRNETVVAIALQPYDLSATLRVRFTSSDAAPATLELRAVRRDTVARFANAGRDGGDFVFRATPGRHRIVLQPEPELGVASYFFPIEREVTLRANEEAVEVVAAQRGGRVLATVHLPDGKTVALQNGLYVFAEAAPGAPPQRLGPYEVTESGKMRTQPFPPAGLPFVCQQLLAPGRHVLTIGLDGYQPQQSRALITPGDVTPIEVWLQP
jgi:hypothetical protein